MASAQPVVRFRAPRRTNRDTRYTLIMTDPDAPSRLNQSSAEIAHWIITNVTLSGGVPRAEDVEDADEAPDEVLSYVGPRPPAGSGAHRYVLILLEPANSTVANTNLTVPSTRLQWGTGQARQGVRSWARLNGLVPVGTLSIVAGRLSRRTNRLRAGANYFQSQNTSVPQS